MYIHLTLSFSGNKWVYSDTDLGPENWPLVFPTCGGKHQSPIEVISKQVVHDEDLTYFHLNELNNTNGVSMVIANIGGYTVEISVSGRPIYITGGGLEGRYRLIQFHYHWGLKNHRGSEHVIDECYFPMEMHIVLYNDNYANFASALHKPKGIAVLAFFYKVGKVNKGMFQITNHFMNIKFKGPENWPLVFPTCGGDRQSPVEVVSELVEPGRGLTDFNLSELNNTNGVSMVIANTGGYTVKIIVSGSPIYITGGGLEGRYRLIQFHYHWGLQNHRGSEHCIDGGYFPMEMHIVLYNDKYADFTSAIHKNMGIAVLAFFFKVGKVNKSMLQITNHILDIKFKDSRKPIAAFPILSLLPKKINSWFRYDGSLTTPPCSESVTWTLFKDEIHISDAQIQEFRNIFENVRGQENRTLADNFRPLQALNSRKVYTNLHFETSSVTTEPTTQ
ncbi:carbonic anhydrase 7-like [Gigantopelta aegis]|uniref:carbonic anhydrase 7-like n=1 Tax=Gigantopelta aegis TaxID=1735272 RepID=UPI001B88BF16|nr:carbonic anhydrase 7-like [Gigantopelta aegis]